MLIVILCQHQHQAQAPRSLRCMGEDSASPIAVYPACPQLTPIHSLHDAPGAVAAQIIGKGVCAIESRLHVQATNEVLWVHLVQVEGYLGHINLLGRLTGEGELVPSALHQDKHVVGTPQGFLLSSQYSP